MVILVIDVMVMSVLLVVTVNWGVDISVPCTEPLPLLKGEIFFLSSKPPGSPYREELNKGILMMQESGKMEMLAKKWIGLQGSQCPADQTGLMGWLTSML